MAGSTTTDAQSAAPPTGAAMLGALDTFARRHLGSGEDDIGQMLAVLGIGSVDELIDQVVPAAIRSKRPLQLEYLSDTTQGESELVAALAEIAAKNKVYRSCIGQGYYDTITPPVVQRNILENPGWYTQYTPYQAEISQGRLEALLNFQTMVADLTALPLANASLLDEATAAAEAMAMCVRVKGRGARGAVRGAGFFLADDCHPQTINVCRTRARSMGIELVVGSAGDLNFERGKEAHGWESVDFCGLLVQYPNTYGSIVDYSALVERAHAAGALVVAATDLLALTMIRPPGEWGADIAIGSAQRLGVPMGFGGPHAAFMSTREQYARKMPGRIVGVSKDARGKPAYRLAVQTREQHIKRDKATSNICTAQVLLAIMASMYAVYHGPKGLKRIARRVCLFASILWHHLKMLGFEVGERNFFDTFTVKVNDADEICRAARRVGYNLRCVDANTLGISLDETTTRADLDAIIKVFGGQGYAIDPVDLHIAIPDNKLRSSEYLAHPVFHSYHSEHELLRYIFRLQSRDISLAQSMIPLGSCTMKLNATSLMLAVTWPGFAKLHPYAPADQAAGYAGLFANLASWLAEITGLPAVSLQPNAGSQGEYAGLLAIRAYHESRGDPGRRVCLIPVSAHGTNPASAVIAGFDVVVVNCDARGDIEVDDLRRKVDQHRDRLGALMITYPSTHGVFEEAVLDICKIVHEHGGQVYMDGANLNAMVGLCRPGEIGADVCHVNLHKTFCIPHGGGGPGMGPIAVAEHLRVFLPGDPLAPSENQKSSTGPVSAAAYGSPSILPISWAYIALMGAAGLTRATKIAIVNANYMAKRLGDDYAVLYTGRHGRVAHEFVLDCRHFNVSAAVEVEDIAKRLMDFGFHAPTMSWPVAGTLMIEPTESESKAELDRFCDVMLAIRAEIRAIEQARSDLHDNPLKNAPHTAEAVSASLWSRPYTREQAAYPLPWLREYKYWPPVARIDNPHGDRHLVCTCPPVEDFNE